MKKKIRITFGNKVLTIALLILVVFGSLMIASAEMGNSVGDTKYLQSVIIKQVVFVLFGFITYFLCMNFKFYKRKKIFFVVCYFIVLGLLLSCKLFGEINGAYAWILLGGFSFQPSELAKVYMIVLAGFLLGEDHHEKNVAYFRQYILAALIMFVVILVYQSDLGSSMVLFVICYCISFIPPYKELKKYHLIMFVGFVFAVSLIGFMFTDFFTNFLKKLGYDYRIGRFLAAADPFLYRYDNGYHVVMSLISLANGNIFGLGYGNSIHKYMNFPNPSNDFILSIIIEELGVIGFLFILIGYAVILFPIVSTSNSSKIISSKIVLLGIFLYFAVHFIFNVGGVSGFIPLTGVPLLLISSGGSSLLCSMIALGIGQSEIRRNKIESENTNK